MSDITLSQRIAHFDAYFRSANGVPPNARISVPTEEWRELHAALTAADETHLRELTAYRTTVDNQAAEIEALRARCAELEGQATGALVGYIHPQNIARLERGEPVAVRKHGWKGEPEQMAVYAAPAPAEPAPQAALAAVPDGWHKAVLDACMVTEACYVEADPAASVRNLIDWHASVAVEAAALAATPAAPADPMDWPLPCDVTVGHGTMRKGVALRTLVLRMKGLYKMATGNDADEVAARPPEQRAQLLADMQARVGATPAAGVPATGTFQQRVQPWMTACFGPEISADRIERNHRFLEEALELVQSNGCTQSEAHQLVGYVFGRPVGEPVQEAGGVMVTLAALCLASGLDMHAAGETELARIWTKVEAIRAKQAAKPKHSPLPMAVPAAGVPAAAPDARGAPDAEQALFLQESDQHLLHRFIETTEDDESYDIGKDGVKRLAELGVISNHGFGRYSVTMFGYWAHEQFWHQNPSLPLKTNADRDHEARAAIAAQAGKGVQ